jgi:hypothetical protein
MSHISDRTQTGIPGYDFGAAAGAKSPVSLDELHRLEACTGWTEEDDGASKAIATCF